MRAFTPRDQKAGQAAAETFRQNPQFKVDKVITELGVSEALVSRCWMPQIVEQAKIVPPRSQIGAITADQRNQIISSSAIAGYYEKAADRESAYEKLQARAGEKVQATAPSPSASMPSGEPAGGGSILEKALGDCRLALPT